MLLGKAQKTLIVSFALASTWIWTYPLFQLDSLSGSESHLIDNGAFQEVTIAHLAPRQPHDAFFGEYSNTVHRDDSTYIIYTDRYYDVYMKAYDHTDRKLTLPSLVARGWNDHICPSLLIDKEGYFHVFYGARPRPIHYVRSSAPLNWTDWTSAISETIGESGTYPIALIINNTIFVLFREGDSYAASLSLATRDLDTPEGTSGAWTVQKIVETSSTYVPMPLSGFEMNNTACFLFNMRDAYLSFPHTNVVPSVREALTVICTADGQSFTDISGSPLDIPLNYEQDRWDFPVVIPEQQYYCSALSHAQNDTFNLGGLTYDGTFVELLIRKNSYSHTNISFCDSKNTICHIIFSTNGNIQVSNGKALDTLYPYECGKSYKLRLKFFFSAHAYRAWIDDEQFDHLRSFADINNEIQSPINIGTFIISSEELIELMYKTGRDHKLITASACLDFQGIINYFFIDRIDSSKKSNWVLMHSRDEKIKIIGDLYYDKYHPSCVSLDDYFYVAVAYFKGEGLYIDNDHLNASSKIFLMKTKDFQYWDERQITAGGFGQVHPIFKRNDASNILELTWAWMANTSTTYLKYAYSSENDTVFDDITYQDEMVRIFPNPFIQSTTIMLNLLKEQDITLELYDVNGRIIKRFLENKYLPSGKHEFTWIGDNTEGIRVTPGVYFVRIQSKNIDRAARVVLIR